MTSDWESYLAKPGHRRLDDASLAEYERRDAVFREVFGSAPFVFTLPICTPPGPLNVLVFDEPPQFDLPLIVIPGGLENKAPGQSERPFTTLVTSGMSDRRMAYPEGTPRRFPRVELAMYLDRNAVRANPDLTQFCSEVLMHYAKQPFLDDTVLEIGMVVPVVTLGQGQVRFLGDSNIAALIVAPPPDDFPEVDLNSRLELDGDGVNLLCLLPITHIQLQIAQLFLGPLHSDRSFENFAVTACLEPIYQGPPKPESASARGSVGKLEKQIRVGAKAQPSSGTTAISPPRKRRQKPKAKAKLPRSVSRGRDRVESKKTQPALLPFWKRPISDFGRGILVLLTSIVGLAVDAESPPNGDRLIFGVSPYRLLFAAGLLSSVLILLRHGLRSVGRRRMPPNDDAPAGGAPKSRPPTLLACNVCRELVDVTLLRDRECSACRRTMQGVYR